VSQHGDLCCRKNPADTAVVCTLLVGCACRNNTFWLIERALLEMSDEADRGHDSAGVASGRSKPKPAESKPRSKASGNDSRMYLLTSYDICAAINSCATSQDYYFIILRFLARLHKAVRNVRLVRSTKDMALIYGASQEPQWPGPTPTPPRMGAHFWDGAYSTCTCELIAIHGWMRAGKKPVDRTEWIIRALKNTPEIEDLRSRVTPLARAIHFAEAYNRGKGRANLDKAVITQLVLQYLDKEGLRSTLRTLESEANAVYQPRDIDDTRLTTLLHVAVKDTDQLWTLSLRA
jgi:hypothetical protein